MRAERPSPENQGQMSELEPQTGPDPILSVVNELRGEIVALKQEVQEMRASDQPDPNDTALTKDELEALMLATSQLEEADDIASAETGQDVGVVLSEEEIAQLLSGAEAGAHAEESPTDIVSADDIKAMLGLRDGEVEEESEPVHAETVLESEVSHLTEAPTPEPLSAPSEVTEPEAEVPAETPIEEAQAPLVLDFETIDLEALCRLPAEVAAEALALPFCIVEDTLHCLCVEPFGPEQQEAVAKASNMACQLHAAPVTRVVAEIRARYGAHDETALRSNRLEVKQKFSLKDKLKRKAS